MSDPGFGIVAVIAAGLGASILMLWLRSKPRNRK